MFHCSVINVLLLIFVISSPEQLWYHIMSFAVCQELFSTFLFFFFAVWPEVFSNFFVKSFVLRCFLNSEVYNTIVLFVCQQLFSVFSNFYEYFMNKRKILCVATVNQLTQKILINLLFFPSAYCAAQWQQRTCLIRVD